MPKLFEPADTNAAVEHMQNMAGLIDLMLHAGEIPPPRPPELCFFLLVAEPGKEGSTINYIGNIGEESTLLLLERALERFKAGMGAMHDSRMGKA